MELHKLGRIALASTISLALMLGTTSCTLDFNLAYAYVTNVKSSPGEILQYNVDYQTGALVEFGTPVKAGNNPVASIATPNAKFIYVVNQGDSTVQEFAIGTDGSLTSKNTYPTGNHPTALTIDPAGKFLYVTYTNGYNATATPAVLTPGGISIFPVNADNSLGAATNVAIGNNPVGITISNFNPTVYVIDQDATNPQVLELKQNQTTGALTPVAGSSFTAGVQAGVQPSAIIEDQTGRFVYVTDQAANQLIGYVVQGNASLVPMVDGPFATQLFPVSLAIDPRARYIYVANFNSKSISSYAINTSTGAPSAVAGSVQLTDPNPVSIAIDPALGTYLYTANNFAGTVTGEQLNPSTGAITQIVNSPYPANGTPSSVVIVASGSHPTSLLYP